MAPKPRGEKHSVSSGMARDSTSFELTKPADGTTREASVPETSRNGATTGSRTSRPGRRRFALSESSCGHVYCDIR